MESDNEEDLQEAAGCLARLAFRPHSNKERIYRAGGISVCMNLLMRHEPKPKCDWMQTWLANCDPAKGLEGMQERPMISDDFAAWRKQRLRDSVIVSDDDHASRAELETITRAGYTQAELDLLHARPAFCRECQLVLFYMGLSDEEAMSRVLAPGMVTAEQARAAAKEGNFMPLVKLLQLGEVRRTRD